MDRNFKRLLDTLKLVPRSRWANTAEIHDQLLALGHEVTRRTVQRDLEALATSYDIECDRRDKAFAWRWAAGAQMPVIPSLDLSKALAFQFMDKELGELMPSSVKEALAPWLKEAQRVVQAGGNVGATRWLRKVAFEPLGPPLQPARVAPGTLSLVIEALYLERQVTAEYKGRYETGFKTVRVHPLGLLKTGLVTYLVVRFDGYQDVRQLAAHRLRRVRILDAAAVGPKGFELQTYLKSEGLTGGGGQLCTVHLEMIDQAAAHLQDTPLASDQVIQSCEHKPGWVSVRATVMDSPRLAWWISGFDGQVVRMPEA
jgi:predicted DNA-binding transcriptional regulator YafY